VTCSYCGCGNIPHVVVVQTSWKETDVLSPCCPMVQESWDDCVGFLPSGFEGTSLLWCGQQDPAEDSSLSPCCRRRCQECCRGCMSCLALRLRGSIPPVAITVWLTGCLYRRACDSRQLAWSKGQWPPGVVSVFIAWTEWTLAMALLRWRHYKYCHIHTYIHDSYL